MKIVACVTRAYLETEIRILKKLIRPIDHQGWHPRKLIDHGWDESVFKEIIGLRIWVAEFSAYFIAPRFPVGNRARGHRPDLALSGASHRPSLTVFIAKTGDIRFHLVLLLDGIDRVPHIQPSKQ